jgi:hypothetical protein
MTLHTQEIESAIHAGSQADIYTVQVSMYKEDPSSGDFTAVI